MKFITEEECDNYYRSLGVDVDNLNKEIDYMGYLLEIAKINVNKKRNWFKRLITPTFIGLSLNPEIQKEFDKLADEYFHHRKHNAIQRLQEN